MLKIPLNTAENELIQKGSQFLSFVYPFNDVAEIRSFLTQDKLKYRDATHHVYAFRVGSSHHYAEGYSDDGEPSGTAGRPVLSLLQSKGLSRVLVVVVRYYGGTPLGVGGLVRAYSTAALKALDKVRWELFVEKIQIQVVFPYTLYNLVRRELPLFRAKLREEKFEGKVKLIIELPKDSISFMVNRWQNLTAGKCYKREGGVYELL